MSDLPPAPFPEITPNPSLPEAPEVAPPEQDPQPDEAPGAPDETPPFAPEEAPEASPGVGGFCADRTLG